jgi:hypothetical protein
MKWRKQMKINLNNFTIEELYEEINIQSNLLDLESGEEQGVRSAIATLSRISCHTERRDALYALCGYYMLETKTLKDKERFFSDLRRECHYELFIIILQDLSQYKNFYRQKNFVDDIAYVLPSIVDKMSEDEKDALELIVQNSVWGKKLKEKFTDKLRDREYDEDFLF